MASFLFLFHSLAPLKGTLFFPYSQKTHIPSSQPSLGKANPDLPGGQGLPLLGLYHTAHFCDLHKLCCGYRLLLMALDHGPSPLCFNLQTS